MARRVLLRALFETGLVDDVAPAMRLIVCVALSHQEDRRLQQMCLDEWARISDSMADMDVERRLVLAEKFQEYAHIYWFCLLWWFFSYPLHFTCKSQKRNSSTHSHAQLL